MTCMTKYRYGVSLSSYLQLVSNLLFNPGRDGVGVEILNVTKYTFELSAGSVIASNCTIENHYENV